MIKMQRSSDLVVFSPNWCFYSTTHAPKIQGSYWKIGQKDSKNMATESLYDIVDPKLQPWNLINMDV